ncbi:MAG: histidine phosphatase family protein [Gemmatimonadota bacterium]|nr:histidine phosphatase family protein [Gemmatimonadota bacterium]
MQLLIVRHADAGDREEFAATGRPDADRPLSDKGRAQMRGVVKAVRALVPGGKLVVTSPYVRAAQTAELLVHAWPDAVVETTGALEPGARPEQLAEFLAAKGRQKVVAVVGHEPDLGALATWCMTGHDASRMAFKKAGACLLEFERGVTRGGGVLRWMMGPKQLAALA